MAYEILQSFWFLKCICSNIQVLNIECPFNKETEDIAESENTVDKKHDTSWMYHIPTPSCIRIFSLSKAALEICVRGQITYTDSVYLSWVSHSVDSLSKGVFWDVNVHEYCSWSLVFSMLNETSD